MSRIQTKFVQFSCFLERKLKEFPFQEEPHESFETAQLGSSSDSVTGIDEPKTKIQRLLSVRPRKVSGVPKETKKPFDEGTRKPASNEQPEPIRLMVENSQKMLKSIVDQVESSGNISCRSRRHRRRVEPDTCESSKVCDLRSYESESVELINACRHSECPLGKTHKSRERGTMTKIKYPMASRLTKSRSRRKINSARNLRANRVGHYSKISSTLRPDLTDTEIHGTPLRGFHRQKLADLKEKIRDECQNVKLVSVRQVVRLWTTRKLHFFDRKTSI